MFCIVSITGRCAVTYIHSSAHWDHISSRDLDGCFQKLLFLSVRRDGAKHNDCSNNCKTTMYMTVLVQMLNAVGIRAMHVGNNVKYAKLNTRERMAAQVKFGQR